MAILERWGSGGTTPFKITSGTLTTTYTDNEEIAVIGRTQQFILYISYTKGGEDGIKIRVQTTTQFYTSGKEFFQESKVDGDTIVLSANEYTINTAGTYRLPIPVGVQEDQIKIAVKATGTPTTGENIELDFSMDKLIAT